MVNVDGGSSSNIESNMSSSEREKTSEESSYELLLKQQQMFLQWQLENELEKVRNDISNLHITFRIYYG